MEEVLVEMAMRRMKLLDEAIGMYVCMYVCLCLWGCMCMWGYESKMIRNSLDL